MNSDKVQFLPFHAINNFMVPEFRLSVLQTVLGKLDELPGDRRGAINSLLKRFLKIPGFRNGAQAPLAMKVKSSASSFERSPDFVAQVLAGWSELHPFLAQQVFDLLKERGWEVLPLDADRAKLPGFLTRWPKGEEFEVINKAFHEKYPDVNADDYDISLMTVWLSGRLPYEVVEKEEAEQ